MISANNKIVYLISPPRSLSTVFLRMMQQRGDFFIFNEPSQSAFVAHYNPKLISSLYKPNVPQSFLTVKEEIFKAAQHFNVFVKEMSFAIKNFLGQDIELMRHPDIYFIFLVRNPHHVIISFYNKQNTTAGFCVNYDLLSNLLSYQGLYELVHKIQQESVNKPLIMFAEDLYLNTETTIQVLCDHVGIDFKETSLVWDDLGNDFNGHEEWHENKLHSHTQHWHGDAIRSTGFKNPSSYEVDQEGIPTFSEIKDLDHRKICLAVYHENVPFYCLLKEAYAR